MGKISTGLTKGQATALIIEALRQKQLALQKEDNASFQTPDGIVRFVKDVIGINGTSPDDKNYLAPYQVEILQAFAKYHKVSVRGPHGIGKTALASWCILWGFSVFDTDVKIATTASAHRQLTHYLWPEVRKWASRTDLSRFGIVWKIGETLLSYGLRAEGKEAFMASSDNPAQIEGAHAKHMMYIFDESKAIPNSIFEAAEGAFSTAGKDTDKVAYALAVSTPGAMAGMFYDIHARKPGLEDWWVRHVTVEEAIAAKRISAEWVDQRKKQWGVTSIVFQNRVLGEFATSAEEMLVAMHWYEAAVKRFNECQGHMLKMVLEKPLVLGVDVARSGEDKTVITAMRGRRVVGIYTYSKEDTMKTVGRVIALCKMSPSPKRVTIAVDVIGIGAGVVDRLKELGYNVLAVNVAEAPKGKDITRLVEFANLRAQLHWMIRDQLNTDLENQTLQLPNHDKLKGDLLAIPYKYNSKGDIQIESKDQIKARIGRSTDFSDSLMLALWANRTDRIQIF